MRPKKTTIHDIAQKLDITASTVSRALKDHPRISDATKKSVLAMADKLNYQPNSIAAALRKGKSNVIGVVIPLADRDFFASVIRGVEEVANKSGYNVIISQSDDSPEKEKANLKTLLQSQVDGVLASYALKTTSFDHYKKIVDQGVPLILFDRTHQQLNDLNVNSVVIDDYQGAYQATTHLIEQGCTRIAHFSGPQQLSIYKNRKKGYIKALKDHDLRVRESLILNSDLKFETAKVLTEELLNFEQAPDAIFSASDYAAVGAMEILKAKGISIPREMAIVGFSNESFTEFIDPGLTTVNQQSQKMGNAAARLFLDQINSKDTPQASNNVILQPELVIRKSSLKN